jgi:hypothetical protein
MDYDFSGLCKDQLEKLAKRLTSLNKSFVREYKIALNVINNHIEMEHRSQTIVEVDDIMRDVSGKCEIFYTEALNKIQRVLRKHL